MSREQSVYDTQEALFDPDLIEMYDDDIPVTIMKGNLSSLDVKLIVLDINGKTIGVDVIDEHTKEYYRDNPYAVFWTILNGLRHSQDFHNLCKNAGLEIEYGYDA